MNDLKSAVEEVCTNNPTLRYALESKSAKIWGVFEVKHQGAVYDRFQICVQVPASYPKDLPKVFETAGRIPRNQTRHVNGDDSLCLFIDEERHLFLGEKASLTDYFEGPLTTHLLFQRYFEVHGCFPKGEMGHNEEGVIQFYQEKFGLKERAQVVDVLSILSADSDYNMDSCPCKSGRLIKECHLVEFIQLQTLFSKAFFRSRRTLIAQ